MNKNFKRRCTRTTKVLVHTFLINIKKSVHHFFPYMQKGDTSMSILLGQENNLDRLLNTNVVLTYIDGYKLLLNGFEDYSTNSSSEGLKQKNKVIHAIKVLETVLSINSLLGSDIIGYDVINKTLEIFKGTPVSTDVLTKGIIPKYFKN